jgi:L-threonylcarbamoyladenylate synthase
VSGGLPTVGLRAPRHPVALALLTALGEPLAAPSANAHTHISPTTAAHVVRSLGDRVDLVLDGGPCAHGIESTVVDLSVEPARVLRAGATSLEAIRAVVPDAVYENVTVSGDAARASPGLSSKHYAPRTRVVLAARGDSFVAEMQALASSYRRVGLICWSDAAQRAVLVAFPMRDPAPAMLKVLPSRARDYGREIFAALHDADSAGLDVLVIESVPDEPEWWAVADRLRRAAEA